VLLIAAITAVALISVVRGLDGGVKVLSEINMPWRPVAVCCALRRSTVHHL
jgi:choline-glycine betaine transporter